jgi:hypothetical protein
LRYEISYSITIPIFIAPHRYCNGLETLATIPTDIFKEQISLGYAHMNVVVAIRDQSKSPWPLTKF